MANVIFFGAEKPLQNLIRYNKFNTFVTEDDVILVPKEFAHKYEDLKNVKTYDSNWSQFDTERFHLYMYLCNFLNRKNIPLNMKLRIRFFGAYKIKSIRLLAHSLKTFLSAIHSIHWRVLLTLRKKLPEEIVEILRKNNFIGNGDIDFLDLFLKDSIYKAVIVFGTFKEPQIIDLSQACLINKKKLVVFPDCWDNISTAPCLPSNVTNLLVWSEQHMKQIADFFPKLLDRSEIIGTYRFPSQKVNYCKNNLQSSSSRINLLYLESSAFEDLGFTLINLIELITTVNKKLHKFTTINLLIRKYPGKKQTELDVFSTKELEQNLRKYPVNVEYSTSSNLTKDFEGKDIVFSELTTAGLEAAFSGIPTIFLKSRKSPRFMDMSRYYRYAFSSEIKDFFFIIDLTYTKLNSDNVNTIESFFCHKNRKHFEALDISYFGVPLKNRKWGYIKANL